MEKKTCSKCGIEKELCKDNFEPRKESKDGFRGVCRDCRNDRRRNLYVETGAKWTDEEINILKELYINTNNKEISETYMPNRSISQITDYATRVLGLHKERPIKTKKVSRDYENYTDKEKETSNLKKTSNKWSCEDIELLKDVYGNMSNTDIATTHFTDKTLNSVNTKARKLKLYKTEEYINDLRLSKLEKIDNHGENNPNYNSVAVLCHECNSEFYVQYGRTKGTKRFYCSEECLSIGRSKFNKGINNPNYNNGNVWTYEMKKNASIRAVKRLSESNYSFTNTKPQSIVNNILDELGICYTNEYNCIKYSIDNHLTDSNLMIEVQGNFFHCNPTMNINNSRKDKILEKDKNKGAYIKDAYGINILYLWEKDILEDRYKCEKLIGLYIDNEGFLPDYHSYNFIIRDCDLCLMENKVNIGY